MREEVLKQIIETWNNREVFKDLEDIPSIPRVDEETYKNIIIPNIIRCGGIPKSQLEIGVEYIGSCRNASNAIWLGDKFEYQRYKFGDTFKEAINHFEDDNGYDLFIPIKKLDQ